MNDSKDFLRTLAVGTALLLSGCAVTVSGVVRNSESGAPVPGAGVQLGPRYTQVDEAGNYRLKVHTYDKAVAVQVVATGYEPATVPVDTSKSGASQVDITLTPTKRLDAPPSDDPKSAREAAGAKAAR